jgi:EAL domain-containing protein (putative c-di-GMP-specific phosphodiesterase class I)
LRAHVLSDVFTRIIKSIFSATNELTFLQPLTVESAILDALKENYKHLPLKLYNRRFDLFCDRLRSIAMHFEPILYLEPGNLHINSWEALARDTTSLSAPEDLFNAAKLWGKKFTTELDICFVQKALIGYREALIEAKAQRPYEIQDISVNVYPETLMRSSYKTAVRNALKESKIAANKLYLEISEKTSIPEEVKSIEEFKEKLTNDFIRELKIGGFAIDDFGVGHASVSRLARLEPEYVKIDRDVLEHEYTETIIGFVLQIATQGSLRHPKVMVEGFEGLGHVNLRKLYDLGVRYIQGYLIGKAGPNLYRLEKETAQYLENLLNKQD